MESLRAEVAPLGIHTTIVNPGFFRTELLTEQSTSYAEPYGPSTIAGVDDRRGVIPVELLTAQNLGVRLARVASALEIGRVTTTQRQVDAPVHVNGPLLSSSEE
jgi:NAD(P)-dependent dehydrogenase (short-subunit alcohol dehydrogenase family)